MKDYITPAERTNLALKKIKYNEKMNQDFNDYHKTNLKIKATLDSLSNLMVDHENLYNADPELYKKIHFLLFEKGKLVDELFQVGFLYQKQAKVGDFLFKKYSKLYIDCVQGRFWNGRWR